MWTYDTLNDKDGKEKCQLDGLTVNNRTCSDATLASLVTQLPRESALCDRAKTALQPTCCKTPAPTTSTAALTTAGQYCGPGTEWKTNKVTGEKQCMVSWQGLLEVCMRPRDKTSEGGRDWPFPGFTCGRFLNPC